MVKKFLVGFDLPEKIEQFSHASLKFSRLGVEDSNLTEVIVNAKDLKKEPEPFLYDFCILSSIIINRPITIRARFEEQDQCYQVTPRYLDHFSSSRMPSGPQPIFTDLNSTLNNEFDLFSNFIRKNPGRAEDFIYFHNTLILRSDIILGFSTQAILLERLVNRFIKNRKINISLESDQKSPTLSQKIFAALEAIKMFPFLEKIDADVKAEGISYLKKLSKSRNDLFHGNTINIDPDVARIVFEINRRLLMEAYGSNCTLVTSSWITIGSSLVRHE